MAATDARPVPLKNTAYRHYFSIRKNDGTLITSWTGADSERSLDGATMVDCTNESVEIATSTGTGYIDLTATEMNTDCTVLKVTVTNTDAIPYVVALFPEEAGDIRTNTTQVGGQTASAIGAVDFDDLGTLESRLTAARAGYIDNLNGHTAQTGDTYALANGVTGFAAIHADTDSLDGTKIPDVLSLANIEAECLDALEGVNLDHFAGTAAAIPGIVSGTYLDQITRKAAGTFNRETHSLEAIYDTGQASWITATGFATATDVTNAHATTDGLVTTVDTVVDAIKLETDKLTLGDAGAGVAGSIIEEIENRATPVDVKTQADQSLVDINLDHLLKVAVTGTDVVDNSVIAYMAAKGATADWDTFVNTSDSLEAISDAGGGGGDATAANQTTILTRLGVPTDLGTGADISTNLVDMAGATFVTGTDSLESIRNQGDSNWSAAASSPLTLQASTAITVVSQTEFTLSAGSTDDDAYNGHLAIITDNVTAAQKAVVRIADYTGSTKTVKLVSAPLFTIATNDTCVIAVAENVPYVSTILDSSRIWKLRDSDDYESDQVITVPANFAGTLGFDLSDTVNPGSTLQTITTVVDDSGDANIVLNNYRLSGDKLVALFGVSGLTNLTNYRIRLTATTTDSNTIPVVGVLECKDNP